MRADLGNSPRRAANGRTAAILLAVAAALFCGVIAAHYSNAPAVTIGMLGFAILGFLTVSIRRNLSGRRQR